MSDTIKTTTESQHVVEEKDQVPTPDTATNVTELDPDDIARVDYDIEVIRSFIDKVFHAGLTEHENILTYASKRATPGYPGAEDHLYKKLHRSHRPMACYYATATAHPDLEDGGLYNRQALFGSLRVVVLDDIGTKIDASLIPEAFKPTYIIESSPGNFQYGYVLKEPLDDIDLSKALIQAVYNSGLTDGGGAMPNKLVRLPCGVNGKKGANRTFHVELKSIDGPLWTPAEIMDNIDVGVTWAQVVENSDAVARSTTSILGGSAWSPIAPQGMSYEGIIDPVLEHLYDMGEVKNEGNEWFDITCPWHHEHTSGGDTAGYSPVGYGSGKYKDMRAFKCFHEHCIDKDSGVFLAHIAAVSGIEAPVYDPAAVLVKDYLFNKVNNSVVDMTGERPLNMKMEGFAMVHNKTVAVTGVDGKVKRIALSKLWANAPHRVDIAGDVSDFSSSELLVNHHGHLFNNVARGPLWGDGAYNQEDVNRFQEFIDYLVPCETERNYFLDWLAAKTQKLEFRGCGVLMVTEGLQGTGRTTLGRMIGMMFGRSNVNNISIGDMVSGNFNEWQAGLFTVTNETLSSVVTGGDTDTSRQVHKVYESLKDIIDPSPIDVTINRKYGTKIQAKCVTSTLMFSNHAHAVATSKGDRRIYVIQNPTTRWTPEQFGRLNAWIDTNVWVRSVYRWLRIREVDTVMLNGPAPSTAGKKIMAIETESTLNFVIEALLEATHVNGIVLPRLLKRVLNEGRVSTALGLTTRYRNPTQVLNKAITNCGAAIRLPIDTSVHRRSKAEDNKTVKWTGRVLLNYAKVWDAEIRTATTLGESSHELKRAVSEATDKAEDYDTLVELALDAIDERDNG